MLSKEEQQTSNVKRIQFQGKTKSNLPQAVLTYHIPRVVKMIKRSKRKGFIMSGFSCVQSGKLNLLVMQVLF